jgi:hypothetical protein
VHASRSEFASISVAGLEVRASRKVWAWLPTTLADVSPVMHLAQHDEHSGPVDASASRSRASAVVNLLYDTPDDAVRCLAGSQSWSVWQASPRPVSSSRQR